MTPKQFAGFLTANEKGVIVNSSDGNVRLLILEAVLNGSVDPSDPQMQEAVGTILTPDRIAAFEAYASSLPAPIDPTTAMVAAGFTQAQANALVGTIAAVLGV